VLPGWLVRHPAERYLGLFAALPDGLGWRRASHVGAYTAAAPHGNRPHLTGRGTSPARAAGRARCARERLAIILWRRAEAVMGIVTLARTRDARLMCKIDLARRCTNEPILSNGTDSSCHSAVARAIARR